MDLLLDAVDADRAFVGEHKADEHLHQRRFTRPVLAEDAVNAPSSKRKINTVTRCDCAESFRYFSEINRQCGPRVGVRTITVCGTRCHQPPYAAPEIAPRSA